MDNIRALLKQRFEQIIVENEMLKAGFAAFPYVVLRDTNLSAGARLAYAVLLMYAWQEQSCFPGQKKMAGDIGVSDRQLRTYLKGAGADGLHPDQAPGPEPPEPLLHPRREDEAKEDSKSN